MPGIGNGKFGEAIIFHFSFKWIFSNWAVSVTAFMAATAFAAGTRLPLQVFWLWLVLPAPVLVLVLVWDMTICSMLYEFMCWFWSSLVMVIVTSYESWFNTDYVEIYRSWMYNMFLWATMIIDREVSTDTVVILIVTFDKGNQYRMRETLRDYSNTFSS